MLCWFNFDTPGYSSIPQQSGEGCSTTLNHTNEGLILFFKLNAKKVKNLCWISWNTYAMICENKHLRKSLIVVIRENIYPRKKLKLLIRENKYPRKKLKLPIRENKYPRNTIFFTRENKYPRKLVPLRHGYLQTQALSTHAWLFWLKAGGNIIRVRTY